jgi:UbiD family decarboxylase
VFQKDVTSIRGTLEFLLKEEKEVFVVEEEVSPILEISGIQKAFENGPALLFENIKGYPGIRNLGNLFSRLDRLAKIFDVPDPRKVKFKCHQAITNPILPRVVDTAPCQEVVITKDIDVMSTLPILKHTEFDGGRLFGGGVLLASEPHYERGNDLSFKRMNFRGKDWASVFISVPSHLGTIRYTDRRSENIPITVNICPPPAVMMVAGAAFARSVVPYGSNELGIAGGLQGTPVEICRAKTVDAYAIADSEWVIEGYLSPELVWETDDAEKLGRARVAPFFPEWPGYLGSAIRGHKFQATAITHRRDGPIFFSPLAHSFECGLGHSFVEASFYEMGNRLNPGFVRDVTVPMSLLWLGGLVFQIKKRGRREEGFAKGLLLAAIADTVGMGLRLAVVVDEDVDIYSADDILWAIATRCEPSIDMVRGPSAIGGGISLQPQEDAGGATVVSRFDAAIGLDATVPLWAKSDFQRSHYPVDRIDLRRWFSDHEIALVKASQSEYARLLAQKGA